MFTRAGVLISEARFAIRTLIRERSYTVVSVALLVLGIGLSSAVFTLLWQTVYANLPVSDPARLYVLSTNVTHNGRSETDTPTSVFSMPAYRYVAAQFTAASGVAARHGMFVNAETPEGPRHLLAEFVSGNFFSTLNLRRVLGRAISPADDAPSDIRFVAVLSYGFWQESFGGQISALNAVIRVNGNAFRVIGVAPKGFSGVVAGVEPHLYFPLAAYDAVNPGWDKFHDWGFRWLNIFTRLPASTSQTAAEAAIQPIYRAAVRQELATEPPQSPDYLRELDHEHISLVPASRGVDAVIKTWGEPLHILQLLTLAVLILTCLNVAGLTVVRAIKQQQEILIRYALGASHAALMRLYFVQTLLLALAGGIGAVWISRISVQLLIHLERMDRRGSVVVQTLPALVFECAAVLAATTLIGLFPAVYAAKANLSGALNEAAASHSAGRSQVFVRRTMAAVQIALSLVLAVAASLFAQSLHTLVSTPVGFNPDRLVVFSIDPRIQGSTITSSELLFSRIEQQLKAPPGVFSVSYGTGGPFPNDADATLITPGNSIKGPGQRSSIRSVIGPNYFKTLGTPLVAGREFDSRDRSGGPLSVIVNQALASRLFGHADPIGQTVTLFNGVDPQKLVTVVGLTADYHLSWKRADASLLYAPAQQLSDIRAISFYIRTVPGAAITEQQIGEVIHHEIPGLSAFDIQTMSTRMEEFASGERAMTSLTATFAALAFLIALTGIYGVVSYTSALRTVEFGVRLSIGATPVHIFGLVAREAACIALAGLTVALPLGWFSLRLIRNQLFGITLDQPAIYGAATLLLILLSLAAALIPARRAAKMDPLRALRHE